MESGSHRFYVIVAHNLNARRGISLPVVNLDPESWVNFSRSIKPFSLSQISKMNERLQRAISMISQSDKPIQISILKIRFNHSLGWNFSILNHEGVVSGMAHPHTVKLSHSRKKNENWEDNLRIFFSFTLTFKRSIIGSKKKIFQPQKC